MNFARRNLGLFLICVFALIPSIFLYQETIKFGEVNYLVFFSKAVALSGIVFYCFNFILSTRAKFLENIFMGLDKLYISHRLTGIFALIFLIQHPLLLLLRYQDKFISLILPPEKNIDVVAGLLALDIFVIVLVITLFISVRYHRWKGIHKILGLSLFLASIHVFLIPSNTSAGFLRYYILGFCVLALISYVYRTLLFKLLVKRYTYLVKSVVNITEDITEISLKEVDKKMIYKAGQFAFFSFQSKYITNEIHPFSFASNPKDELIKVIAKRSGDYTNRLHQLNPDTLVKIEGPYGAFGKYSKRNKQLWIAGGIGITPFLSMLKEVSNKEITLIHVVSAEEHLIYQKAIKESGIKYVPYISKKEGRIDVEKIMKLSPIKGIDILMCGPLPMMKDLKKQFKKQGVSGNHIFFEDFTIK